jgi:type I restriction enzyme, S subunit
MDAPVLLPPLEVQQRIVDVLGSLDAKIDLNHRTNETLEELARAVFHNWFVSFAPVVAKSQGARQYAGMSSEVFDALPNQLDESQEGTRPAGWPRVPLSDVIALLGGGTPSRKRPEYWGGQIPWFSVRDAPLNSDIWTIETKESITEAGVANSSARVLRPGTTIISARGTVGRLAIAGVPMATNQSCYGVVGAEGFGDFYTYFVIHHAVVELQRRTHGSVFDTITRTTFDSLSTVRPPTLMLQEFERIVSPLLEQVRANLFENRHLEQSRDELLPHLIHGVVRPSREEEASR